MRVHEQTKYIERWQHLIRVLEPFTVMQEGFEPHTKTFDLGHWYVKESCQEKRMDADGNTCITESCQTVACALGWCGLDGWFRRRGLTTTEEGVIYRTNQYRYSGFDAATEFFSPPYPNPGKWRYRPPFDVRRIFYTSEEYERRWGRCLVRAEHVIALVREYVEATYGVKI